VSRLRAQTASLTVALLCFVTGCAYLRPARVPMSSVAFEPLSGPQAARGAIVILPGFGDDPETFRKHGFVAALRAAAPGYDVYGADAHFGYYRKGILVSRLDEDVIEPLKRRGYRELWLAGASMGGHGAVGFAREHPSIIQGLLLFAPYLGSRSVVEEVEAAGGLCKFDAPRRKPDDAETFARENLLWLREQACDKREVALWLAVGGQDRLLRANRLVGEALEGDHLMVVSGGHGWEVWTRAVTQLAARAVSAGATSGTTAEVEPR